MALTVTKDMPQAERISRSLGILTGSIDFDDSYPTGGEDASDISDYFQTCLVIQCEAKSGYIFEYDKTNDKIKVYYPTNPAAHSHVAFTVNATETAGDSTTFVSITEGDGTAQSGIKVSHAGGAGSDIDINTDSVTIADSAGAEVANGTDLSGLTGVKFIAIGLI